MRNKKIVSIFLITIILLNISITSFADVHIINDIENNEVNVNNETNSLEESEDIEQNKIETEEKLVKDIDEEENQDSNKEIAVDENKEDIEEIIQSDNNENKEEIDDNEIEDESKEKYDDESTNKVTNTSIEKIDEEYAENQFIVKFKSDKVKTSSQSSVTSEVKSLLAEENLKLASTESISSYIHGNSVQLVEYVGDERLEVVISNIYENNKDIIEYIEPNYVISSSDVKSNDEILSKWTPNDSFYSYLWGLNGSYGIKASTAWDITKGNPEVVVAIVDTGVDLNHEDLANNIYRNPNETLNDRDDDGNGYIDDIYGWDFVSYDNIPDDEDEHGTHVAGTIAAEANSIGVVGVAPQVKILPVRILDENGRGYVSDAVLAVNYIKSMNVDIVNHSWGTSGYSSSLYQAMRDSNDLHICAAGNDSYGDADYPARFTLDNIISVASITASGELSGFSNYGSNSVDVAAPGSSIFSTVPGSEYGYMSGTSMATPHVTGIAALVKSKYSNYSITQIKNAIINNVTTLNSLSGKVSTGGMVDASKALGVTSSPTPDPNPNINDIPGIQYSGLSVSGYVSRNDSNVNNVYSINVNKGDVIEIDLRMESGDLDLALYDKSAISINSAHYIASSQGVLKSEKITYTFDEEGTYYVRVWAYSGSGNYTLTIKNNKQLITLGTGSYEENRQELKYSVGWSTASNNSYSGGMIKYADTKGEYVEFKFNGTKIDLYASMNKVRGKADVYIDGIFDKTIDQYSSTDKNNTLVYSKSGLANGEHIIKVVVKGEKNSNSTSTRISVDKFVVSKGPATLNPGTYQETNKDISYKGTWSNSTNSSHSEGTAKISNIKNSTIEFKFNGTSFEWYGQKAYNRGKAKVYIDGTAVETIDLYSSTSQYNTLIYSKTGLLSGEHTVKIEVLGEKRSISTDTYISFDRLIIKNDIPVLAVGTHEDTYNGLKYVGAWSISSNSSHSGGTARVSNTKNSKIEFKINGTSFEWYGQKASNRGKAKIYIDGTVVSTVDLYSESNVFNTIIYSKTGLSNGEHTIKIEVLGEKTSGATDTYVSIDRVIVKKEAPTLRTGSYEESNSGFTYKGTWSLSNNSKHSGGVAKISNTKNSTVEFKFDGTEFKWYGQKANNRGKARVYIDGTAVATVDLYSNSSQYNTLIYSKTGLFSGEHTVKIQVLGEKSSSSTGTYISLDKIVVSNNQIVLNTGTHQETSNGFRYVGSWTNSNNINHSGGTAKVSNTSGSSMEFKFNGTNFEWYGQKANNRGKAKIYIDGTVVDTVDLYTPLSAYNTIIYSKSGLSNGEHTVKIEVLGQKCNSSTGTYISVDRVVVSTVLSAGTYEETDRGINYVGSWSTSTLAGHSGGTAKYSSTKGNSIEFKFKGTGFELYGLEANNRGKAKVYIDGVLYKVIDQYSPVNDYQRMFYYRTGLSNGEHTVRIEVLGEKISESSNTIVTLDKIVIK